MIKKYLFLIGIIFTITAFSTIFFLHIVVAQEDAVSLGLVSPQGGESFSIGQTVTIEWNQTNADRISISYYDSNNTGSVIVSSMDVDKNTSGSYEWTIPVLPTRDDYYIKISAYNTNISGKTVEGNTFTINGRGAKTDIISNVRVTASSKSEIIVEWDTNIPEITNLYWSPRLSCNVYKDKSSNKVSDSINKTKHKMYLGANLCFQLEDSSGDLTEVQVSPSPTVDDMKISNFQFVPGANSVKVSWTTDIPASGAVYVTDYSFTTPYYDSDMTAVSNNLTNDHSFTINGLTPETGYKLRIESISSNNQLATNLFSSEDSFRTPVADNLPDLTVTDIKFTGTKQNEAGTLSATIKNIGSDLTSSLGLTDFLMYSILDWFYFSNSPYDITSYTTDRTLPSVSNPLKTNETITFYWPGSFNRAGNLLLQFGIDKNNTLAEVNENNNILRKTITILEEESVSQNINNESQAITDITNTNEINSVLNKGNSSLSFTANNFSMYNRLKGKILLKVEDSGQAYYVHPKNNTLYYLGRPDDAFQVMRQQGVGITNANLYQIPIGITEQYGADSDGDGLSDYLEDALDLNKSEADTDGDGYSDATELNSGYSPWGSGKQNLNNAFAMTQAGNIFLQVEKNGEAWYVSPEDGKRYFLGRPGDAFNVMRNLGLGISDNDFDDLTGQ